MGKNRMGTRSDLRIRIVGFITARALSFLPSFLCTIFLVIGLIISYHQSDFLHELEDRAMGIILG